MIIMDIDYFKQINDYLGHYTGDQVLEETAEILQACFRTDDIAGRLGGDEFVVFMKAVSDPEIVKQRCFEVLDRVKAVTMEKQDVYKRQVSGKERRDQGNFHRGS